MGQARRNRERLAWGGTEEMTDERTAVGAGPDEVGRPQDGAAAGFRAFVLSDIRGYSSFSAVRGDEAAAALTGRFIAIAERVLGGSGGESIGNRGDEVLFAFESPRQAIRAALAFELALLEATREDPSLPMPAGVGIDVGEAVVVPDGWRANAINVAARLCSLARGGEVLATREVTHLAQAIDGVRYDARPATQVKGIAEPVNPVRVVSHIRSGIRYSNGVPLRASDFRRGLERAFDVGGGPVADLGLVVGAQKCLEQPNCDLSRGIVADDATHTVTIHLTKPDPDLFAQLTLPAAYPVPPGTGIKLPARSIPGTGPYEIASYSPDLSNNPRAHGELVLKRNPYFRQWSAAAQPAGFPDRIVLYTNYSEAQQVAAVERGRADVAWNPPTPSEISTLSQNLPSQLHENAAPETYYTWLNVRSAPFDNLLARQAVNYAVNRQALVKLALGSNGGGGRPTCQLLPPDFPGYVPYCPYTLDPAASGRWLAPDLTKAQALVRESGTLGARVTVLQGSDVSRRYGQTIVASLREIGYRAKLADLPPNIAYGRPPSFYSRFQAGFIGWYADYVAPDQIIGGIVQCSAITQGGNLGQFCDRSLDAKIASALSEEGTNPGLASTEWTRIDREVTDMAVEVPLGNQLNAGFVARRVGNFQYNPQWGMLVDQLWVR
jgi:peptide/nickel transport system substrate-binding protein